jgi:hypothetical protein
MLPNEAWSRPPERLGPPPKSAPPTQPLGAEPPQRLLDWAAQRRVAQARAGTASTPAPQPTQPQRLLGWAAFRAACLAARGWRLVPLRPGEWSKAAPRVDRDQRPAPPSVPSAEAEVEACAALLYTRLRAVAADVRAEAGAGAGPQAAEAADGEAERKT